MDREWDLFEMVRACAASFSSNPTTAVNQPFPSFPSDLPPPVDGEKNSLGFPALGDGMKNSYDYEGLQEIYYNFRYGNQAAKPNPTAAAAGTGAFAASVVPAAGEPASMQIQDNVQFVISPAIGSSHRILSAQALLQLTKKGRRKNYQPKLIRQMTKDELNTDSWAWRKYGQKPIKGFENPRCYYKCSTSKGCSARKQVELYSKNPDTYLVTYSGEHTHPRPTRRSSLAGSTRVRFANPSGARNGGRAKKGASTSAAPAPPPAAAASFSPDTPSTESESVALFDDLSMMTDVCDGAAGDEENLAMLANELLNDDDDFFDVLNDSDDFPGVGDFFSQWSFGGAAPFDGSGGF